MARAVAAEAMLPLAEWVGWATALTPGAEEEKLTAAQALPVVKLPVRVLTALDLASALTMPATT